MRLISGWSRVQIDKNAKLKADMDKTLETRWQLKFQGGAVLKAHHARIDIPKDQISLLSRGGGVVFYDHVRVWKALPLAK